MSKLGTNEVMQFLLIITILLATARILGELFKKIGLPAVIGELLGGILLGPSLIGAFFPNFFQTIFSDPKQPAIAFDGLSRLSIMLLLFVAGMEVNLNNIRTRGKPAAKISFFGIFFPLAIGFAATWFFYDRIFSTPTDNKIVPALFMGTALSITALSVMAKILIDLDLIKTRFGNLMMTAAMVNDFIGWMLFSVVITMANLKSDGQFSPLMVLLIVVVSTVFLLTIGRKAIDLAFQFANKKLSKPGAELSLAILLCFAGGIFTEWLGIKAIFGAFLMGIAIGDSKNFSERSKQSLHDMIAYVFSPLFFVSVGLRVNVLTNFNLGTVLFILAISIIGKLLGGFIGARLSGFKTHKAFAVGFGMNARGSQEIVLGLVALQAKIIDERIFVGLLVMTFVTILVAGPAIKYFLRKHDASQDGESTTTKQSLSIPPLPSLTPIQNPV
ncbi:MAG TPA: cation:proton antiporter [Chitinophagales bacterium]|nr:cation:proton antiporter [Chitinophagales bacterium]